MVLVQNKSTVWFLLVMQEKEWRNLLKRSVGSVESLLS